jgi:hypothetical protein
MKVPDDITLINFREMDVQQKKKRSEEEKE